MRSNRFHRSSQHQALLEYASIRSACPEGIYLSLRPGNPSQWSGVLFVREGPYAPAILRFQVSFPSNYPVLPPLITFRSDIFHPLVTPLTTYTYTTGSLSSDPVSATDEERLPPGGFSLRFGFPHWFGRAEKTILLSSASSRNASGSHNSSNHASVGLGIHGLQDFSQSQIPQFQRLSTHTAGPQAMRDSSGTYPSTIEILEYLKSSFDDETTLDALPIEASGNPGAWNAWQAHRKYSLNDPQMKMDSSNSTTSSKQAAESNAASNRKQPEEWSWDGVWEERVQKGIDASMSDSVLYGSLGGSDDLIRFSDANDDLLEAVKYRT